jgi:hypothetical protein
MARGRDALVFEIALPKAGEPSVSTACSIAQQLRPTSGPRCEHVGVDPLQTDLETLVEVTDQLPRLGARLRTDSASTAGSPHADDPFGRKPSALVGTRTRFRPVERWPVQDR